MRVGDRCNHARYGNGTVRTLDGRQAIVLFDRDAACRAPRRVWLADLTPGERFYPGAPTPTYPKAVA